jgi:hypothetical protein
MVFIDGPIDALEKIAEGVESPKDVAEAALDIYEESSTAAEEKESSSHD